MYKRQALNSLPKSALAPILIVWFGNTTKTIIIASVSLTIIVTILTVLNGFQSVEEEKVNLIYALGGSKSHVMVKLLLPYNIPVIMNVLKVNIGLCLIGVIIGEFLSARAGLGYLIIYGCLLYTSWLPAFPLSFHVCLPFALSAFPLFSAFSF